MDEPWNWFKSTSKRAPSDLESLSLSVTARGKVTVYTCNILKAECRYDQKSGSGDCRRCTFATAYMAENPGAWKRPVGE